MPARGLPQVRSRRYRALQGAWRRQAVPEGGLPQVCSRRRHAILQGAWRRQALSARGLPQGSSRRRHAALYRAWGRQAVPAGGLLQVSRSSCRQCVLHALPPARAARRCTRRCICSNSVTRPRRPKPRVGSRSSRENSTGGGGWRVRGSPHPSERSDVLYMCKTVHDEAHFNRELVALGSLRGGTALRQRDARWVQHGQLV